jgi:hypothetical protein
VKTAEGMFGIFQSTLATTLNMETDTQNNKHLHDFFLEGELANHLLHTSQKLADTARTTDVGTMNKTSRAFQTCDES